MVHNAVPKTVRLNKFHNFRKTRKINYFSGGSFAPWPRADYGPGLAIQIGVTTLYYLRPAVPESPKITNDEAENSNSKPQTEIYWLVVIK